MNRQAILDVLNSLEVVETNGGDSPYILVENNEDVRMKLNAVGVTDEVINQYGDDDSFDVLALGCAEGYADYWEKGKFVVWGPIDDELRYRVLNGEGTATDAERLLKELEGGIHPREQVRWFAGQMEAKLQENDHKGGWEKCQFPFLYRRLIEEVQELRVTYDDQSKSLEDMIRESADVANFAMMIADKARGVLSQR
ncbi:hypothetical protein [Brevibacillus sp. MER 51]|uniref:hypothetical protein n=1 Tax=Brevibacillus sp. MER 51 TaxID=2939560 RepID=UPI002041BF98|nr:hypothetical protein [Brevibacillus sp. MER 51]MCM3141688.1 hypothetical protein [Brevibacillus sp. MER 51]